MTQRTKDMLLFDDSSFLRINTVDSIVIGQRTDETGFWPFKQQTTMYVLTMVYTDKAGSKYTYKSEHPNYEFIHKKYKDFLEQIKMQLKEDEYITNALEEALEKV